MATEEIKETRLIAVYDKQLGYYIKSIPLIIDLNDLKQLFQQYVDNPLSYSYKITPEMSNLLKKYSALEFDYNRFDYTMEAKVIRIIAIYNKKTKVYIGKIILKIDLDILNELFTQYEDDPLFYGCYGVTRKLVNDLKKHVEMEGNFEFDFRIFIYIVEAVSAD